MMDSDPELAEAEAEAEAHMATQQVAEATDLKA